MTASWREAHRQLEQIAQRRGALDAAEARWLVIAREAGVHRELGYAMFTEYLERLLGYAPRTARERMRVAEALQDLPRTLEALERGDVSFSVVRALTRDDLVDRDNEEVWLARVANMTVREVEDDVAGRFPGSLPTDRVEPDLIPKRLTLELTPEVYAAWQCARRALEDQAGETLDDSAVVAAMSEAVLDPAPGDEKTRPHAEIAVSVCAHCDAATVDAAGRVIAISPGALVEARCDAAHVNRDGSLTRDIPAHVRRVVEHRDHHRCVVPGCRSSRRLHMHHIQDRAEGGTHVPENLCLLCRSHHGLLHRGKLQVVGRAPDLRITHADGRPYGTDPQIGLIGRRAFT